MYAGHKARVALNERSRVQWPQIYLEGCPSRQLLAKRSNELVPALAIPTAIARCVPSPFVMEVRDEVGLPRQEAGAEFDSASRRGSVLTLSIHNGDSAS